MALVASIAGGAYAQGFGTMVYDFKATVKNTNIKTIKVKPSDVPFTVSGKAVTTTWTVDVKYVQNTVLYGYLIDGGYGWTWAVIANQGQKPKLGRLFYAYPMMVQLFDPKFSSGDSVEDPFKVSCGAEGGLLLYQGEDYDGDNVLWDGYDNVPVQYYYDDVGGLFGHYDDYGACWLAAAGFGSSTLETPQSNVKDRKLESPRFTLNLAGSVIGGWNYCDGFLGYNDPWFPIETWVCGEDPREFVHVEYMNSWIAGTWTLKTNTKLQPLFAGEYGPCYTAAAMKAINPNQHLEDVEDYLDYP